MFDGIEEVQARLTDQSYVCDRRLATVVFLATRIGKPILVEGPAGVGKTELAKALGAALDTELIRLQCYEGLDEAKALYEWEYGKQLLYTQVLREKIGDLLKPTETLHDAAELLRGQEDVFFSEAFLVERPILRAIRAERAPVLLIDEIDRADEEFEAFLLEFLSDFQVSIPEIGTIRAKNRPLVVLTSNRSRELSEALKRRCLHLQLDYPSPGRRARDRAAQGARDPRRARRRAGRDDPAAAHGRPAQGAEHRRDPRLGAGARRPRRRVARQAAHRGDAQRDRQVRPRRREGAPGARAQRRGRPRARPRPCARHDHEHGHHHH